MSLLIYKLKKKVFVYTKTSKFIHKYEDERYLVREKLNSTMLRTFTTMS